MKIEKYIKPWWSWFYYNIMPDKIIGQIEEKAAK